MVNAILLQDYTRLKEIFSTPTKPGDSAGFGSDKLRGMQ